mgnify:CR=1 FL=1
MIKTGRTHLQDATPLTLGQEFSGYAQQIENEKLMWYVIIHLTFVLSAMGMAFLDRMNKH